MDQPPRMTGGMGAGAGVGVGEGVHVGLEGGQVVVGLGVHVAVEGDHFAAVGLEGAADAVFPTAPAAVAAAEDDDRLGMGGEIGIAGLEAQDLQGAADEVDHGVGFLGLRNGDDVAADDGAGGLDADVGAVDEESAEEEDLGPEEDVAGPGFAPEGVGKFHCKSLHVIGGAGARYNLIFQRGRRP